MAFYSTEVFGTLLVLYGTMWICLYGISWISVIVVKRTEFCGFWFQLCGEQLNFLVNDVFKPVFCDSLIRFGVFSTFDR